MMPHDLTYRDREVENIESKTTKVVAGAYGVQN